VIVAPHPVLHARDLGVTYPGGTRALSDVTFSVGEGELVAVVGPNGAGKSTLFRAISGLVLHDGSVEMCGAHCLHRDRLTAAYIPQRHGTDLNFPITVEQVAVSGRRRFLRFGQLTTAAHREAAHEALERVGLAECAARPLGSLSGGQVQRALIARALAQEARLLMLDEALAGVDPAWTEELFDLFTQLTSGGTSVLVATHDLDLVRRRFPRCVLVNTRLVDDGAPARVIGVESAARAFGPGH
jgi:ABC-type Mn2+/Zn2+ transport system ATPase subunit